MNAVIPVKSIACAVLLMVSTVSSFGLTMGRAQGALFIGRPLDIRVPLQLDASEDLQPGCLQADVSYGEQAVDPARVTVRLESGVARVQSSVLVDEPVVNVNLRIGCQQRASRRYTLFPDVTTNVVDLAPAPVKAAPPTVALPTLPAMAAPVTGGAPAARSEPVEPATPRATIRKKPRVDTPEEAASAEPKAAVRTRQVVQPVKLPAPAVQVQAPRVSKAHGRSRLKLDPLDLSIERDPVLRSSNEIASLPMDSPDNRAAAAALWKSLNASPEDIMREDAKALAISHDLKALYTVTTENQKNLMELAARVERAEGQRYANGLVYTLSVLLLLCLSALTWTVMRARAVRKPNWADGLEAQDSLLAELVQADAIDRHAAQLAPEADREGAVATPTRQASAVARAVVPEAQATERAKPSTAFATASDIDTAPQAARSTEVDFDLDLMMPPSFVAQPPASLVIPTATVSARAPDPARKPVSVDPSSSSTATASASPGRDLSLSLAGGVRAIDSEELMDVRQQADFFVSLGEHQKAIDILTTRVAQCGESSPLVCLDLLKLYHTLGRESDFEFMRAEFNSWFTGQVPPFASFGNEGQALEHYTEVVEHITALWPSRKVLEYIESCIYHHAANGQWPVFDLLAYRELLLLHAVAKRIIRMPTDAPDSHASELIRIPPPAPILSLGIVSDPVEGGNPVVHRAGPQHRGGWKRKPTRARKPVEPEMDPEAEVETRGAPLGAMKIPPQVSNEPVPDAGASNGGPKRDEGPTTDFNFLSL